MAGQSITRRGHKFNVLITHLIRLILPHQLSICFCPSSRCSSRCCQRSRSNGRAIRRRDQREWLSWPKSSPASNLLPGWRKMVSKAVKVGKVKDYTHSKEVALTKGTWAMQLLMLWMSRIISVLDGKCLNEFKREAVKNKCWGRETWWKKCIKDTHTKRGILNLHQSYYFCLCASSSGRERSIFLNHHMWKIPG